MNTKSLLCSILVFSLLVSRVNATVFLNENFDGYANQAAFEAVWAPNTLTATLSIEQAVSLDQSVKGLTTATRNARSIGEIGFLNGSPDTIVFRFDFYDSNGAAAAYRQYAEIDDGSAPGSAGQLFAMGLNNNIASTYYMARILGGDGGTGAGVFFKLDGVGAPTRTTGWHTLELQLTDNFATYYVDSILSKTVDISALTDRSLDYVKVGSNLSSTQVAYFDNFWVERIVVVPEPGSFALMALGFGAFLGIRRFRK